MHHIDCAPTDVNAEALGVSWNGELPEVLADKLIDASPHPTTCHLAVIGGSHVVTVETSEGSFREEISCDAAQSEDARWPLPESITRENYLLQTNVAVLSEEDFVRAAEEISQGGEEWLIASFPGPTPHHLTALTAEFLEDVWEWFSYHLYPEELTIVSTRSIYKP